MKKNVDIYYWHQKNITYLIHKKYSLLTSLQSLSSKTSFSFYKLIYVGIKGYSLNFNFLFFSLKYVETSYKMVLSHLAPSHQKHKYFVSGEVRKTRLCQQPQLVIDVI
jgi:hypothetical protein